MSINNYAGCLIDNESSAIEYIEDFGEKIGGAKKDLWRVRGMISDDLDALTNREADKFVKKSNIWKNPDYEKLVGCGMPIGVAFFRKKVRDSLPASPQYLPKDTTTEARLSRQKQYVDTVRCLMDFTESIETEQDCMDAFNNFFVENGFLVESHRPYVRYEPTEKFHNNPQLTKKLLDTMDVYSEDDFEYSYTKKAKKEQFCVKKEDKIPRGYSVRFNDGKFSWSNKGDWAVNTWYVVKGHSILQMNFATREDAVKWAQEYAKKKRSGGGKKRYTPPQLQHVRRTGPDYRNAREITGADYMDTFGFRGGEYGNWMSQNDRQESLNMGYDALRDLASCLGIETKAISYYGKLAIAFGSRGSGNAVAHYDPLRKVINLTKMHGAGSLAHEWWHGLDDYLGSFFGVDGYLSDAAYRYPLFHELLETIKYRLETMEEAEERQKTFFEREKRTASNFIDMLFSKFVSEATDSEKETFVNAKETFLSGNKEGIKILRECYKVFYGRVIPKSDRERLNIWTSIFGSANTKVIPGKVATTYYSDSIAIGKQYQKDGDYWESNVELTARAFACYVQDRLGYKSDYLVGHAESGCISVMQKNGSFCMTKAFPTGEERTRINEVFDKIFADLRSRMGIFGNSIAEMKA